MTQTRNAIGIFLYVNIVSWLLLLCINLLAIFGFSDKQNLTVNFYLKGLLLNVWFLVVFFYFQVKQKNLKIEEIFKHLTSLFVTGLIAFGSSLVIQFFFSYLQLPPIDEPKANSMNLLYHVQISLVTIFLTQVFFTWKSLVLYQNTERVRQLWQFFEYALLASMLFNFFELGIDNLFFLASLILLIATGLYFSVNLKWIAFLSAIEKWQAVLLVLLLAFMLIYFFRTVIIHSVNPFLSTDLSHSVYVLATFSFCIFYNVFALLVIFFNIPITPVLEKRNEEIISFQRLVQNLNTGDKEEKVYEILLDIALNTIGADAALLEILDENGTPQAILPQKLDAKVTKLLKNVVRKSRLDNLAATQLIVPIEAQWEKELQKVGFGSVIIVPLTSYDNALIGTLTLLKKAKYGFDNEQNIIRTFVKQASIAISNLRLLTKTLEAERYRQEVQIARNVQRKLLPILPENHPFLDMAGFSEAAYQVGGDYYDYFQISPTHLMYIVADVSGKGSMAAFSMAQMKGIFQSLAQLELSTQNFLVTANKVLGNCLENATFLTATVALIDTQQRTIEITRAGHTPTLYYEAQKQQARYLKDKGLALGMLRNSYKYADFLETQLLHYQPKDILLLYTDGVNEARNVQEEEYDYDRLKTFVEQNAELNARELIKNLYKQIRNFVGKIEIHDDFTALCIKFRA